MFTAPNSVCRIERGRHDPWPWEAYNTKGKVYIKQTIHTSVYSLNCAHITKAKYRVAEGGGGISRLRILPMSPVKGCLGLEG